MTGMPITSVAAALLSLIFLALSVLVSAQRGRSRASLGDGSANLVSPGQESAFPLLVASRRQANFAEYVPLSLILLGLLEQGGAARWLVAVLAAVLVVARLLHPVGIGRKSPNPFRAAGAFLTLAVIGVASLYLLIRTVLW